MPSLFHHFKGRFKVDLADPAPVNESSLNDSQRETIDSVLEFYGSHDSQWLGDLKHMERPWKDAREGTKNDSLGRIELNIAVDLLKHRPRVWRWAGIEAIPSSPNQVLGVPFSLNE